MEVTRDLACIGRGAALRSYWAHVAVPLRGAVQQRASVVHGDAGLKQFPVGADVGSALPVPMEVRTGEDAVLPIAHFPYRDVRDNSLLLDQPAEELARPIGRVRGKAPWFQRELRRSGYFPLSVSLTPPTAFWIFPAAWSALPSDSSLASPSTLPAISLVLPLISFADPSTRSLSMISSSKT